MAERTKTGTGVFVTLVAFLLRCALCGNEVYINSLAALIAFSNDVNSGTTYFGTTVFLTADLDFSGGVSLQFKPIGFVDTKDTSEFSGTFDGQGYMISNLEIESGTIRSIGLFGLVDGGTVRNLVIGPSCSMTSSYNVSGYPSSTGGIAAFSRAYENPSLLESLVNMATISYVGEIYPHPYAGYISTDAYIGGIAGFSDFLESYKVINCANYGTLIHDGYTSSVIIGGIIGNFPSTLSQRGYVYNCFNSGTIYQKKKPRENIRIGGIVGWAYSCYIENCVSIGSAYINVSNPEYEWDRPFGIVGIEEGHSKITHCFWTNHSENGTDPWYSKVPTECPLSSPISALNESFMDELNAYSKVKGWNVWLLNPENKTIAFKANGGDGFKVSTQLILLPTLKNSPNLTFNGWFSDESCSSLYESASVNKSMTFYGGWKFTVTFNPKEGIIKEETKEVTYGNLYGDLPRPENPGTEFVVWSSPDTGKDVYNNTRVTLRMNHTLDANYITTSVYFDPAGGSSDVKSKVIVFGNEYGGLPVPTRTGFNFVGWFTEMNGRGIRILASSIVSFGRDHTLYANWTAILYSFRFDFTNGTVETRYFMYEQAVSYPNNPVREGYEFSHWSRVVDRMPDHNEEARVIWNRVAYRLSFDFGNGTIQSQFYEYNQQVQYPNEPEREGHSFNGWSEAFEFMPGRDVVLTIMWTVNNYTLILDYGNSVRITITVRYDDVIQYPGDLQREGYSFKGWSNVYERMPAHNVTSVAQWESIHASSGGKVPAEPDKKKNGMSTIVIICLVLVVILFITAVIIALLFIAYVRSVKEKDENGIPLVPLNKKEERRRFAPNLDIDTPYRERMELIQEPQCQLDKMYPQKYPKPSLKAALVEADLTEEQADQVSSECDAVANRAEAEGKLVNGLTKDDAAAIAMYTYDFGPSKIESNPYRIINKALTSRDPKIIKSARGLLCLLMAALRRLPRVSGMTLYRGVRGDFSLDGERYVEGNIITWPALTSASPDVNATKASLARGSAKGKASGTFFVIENAWGYNIQPYSLYPGEVEIIIEPEQQFEVVSVIESEGITIVTLRMIESPTIQLDAWK